MITPSTPTIRSWFVITTIALARIIRASAVSHLPERGFNLLNTNQNVQVTETAILNPTTINETRFQFSRGTSEQTGNNDVPALDVSGSFGSGGSQVGHSFNERKSWELNNFTAKQKGTHAIKFGGRVRHVKVDDTNERNFGGSWTFTGGFGLTSIERYQLTLRMQEQGFTPAEIRAAGGGATSSESMPEILSRTSTQTDYGVFIQDDWRIRPNLTLSYGLRYEIQTNAHSKYDFAPRIAVAWSPGAANSARPPKMVIRVGTGFFYNRFNESYTLQANRFNGVQRDCKLRSPSPSIAASHQVVGGAATAECRRDLFVLNQWSPTSCSFGNRSAR